MRLHIKGHMESGRSIGKAVGDAFEQWLLKLKSDNPELKDQLENAIGLEATDVTVDFKFMLEGSEDWQVITTDNHSELPELLVVEAETDEEGKLLWDTVKDNDGNSNFNEVEAMITAKQIKDIADMPVIKGEFGIVPQSVIAFPNEKFCVTIGKSNHVGYIGVHVTRYNSGQAGFTDLIGEVEYQADQFDKVKKHYQELHAALYS